MDNHLVAIQDDSVSHSSTAADDVLIVDDDQAIRDSLSAAFEEAGLRVYAVADGKQALEALLDRPAPCVIVLDLLMPGMNGWEFLAQKELSGFLAQIPVVVITAVSHGAIPGIAAWLQKPFRMDALLAKIAQYCGHGALQPH